MKSKLHIFLIIPLALLTLFAGLPFQTRVNAEELDALNRKAAVSALGSMSFLTSLTQAGDRIVAVGERGLILLSDDGRNWRQASVPVSVTLTAVSFFDQQTGYAIGHGGSVLKTVDGGESWVQAIDGIRIAATVLKAARAAGDEDLIPFAQRLVTDGPDKPMLDLLVLSEDHVVVVGAYGLVLQTLDGGTTWESLMDRIDNPIGLHIYAIRKKNNKILLAGEQGAVWYSENAGASYDVLLPPYEGSFFTAALVGNGDEIVLAGLRGNVWRSVDSGENWNQIAALGPATINAARLSSSGGLLLVNQAGRVMHLLGDEIVPVSRKPLPPLNDIVELQGGRYLMVSRRGIVSTENEGQQ